MSTSLSRPWVSLRTGTYQTHNKVWHIPNTLTRWMKLHKASKTLWENKKLSHWRMRVNAKLCLSLWKELKCPSMDKWIKDVVNTHTHTHTGILLSHKKEWYFALYSNMDGLTGHYAKWNKRQILYDITHVESKKYNKLVNITKRKKSHRYKEQTSGCQWGGVWRRGMERYKLLGVRWVQGCILYNTGNRANII